MAVTKHDFPISAAATGRALMLVGRGTQPTEIDRNLIRSGNAARLFRL